MRLRPCKALGLARARALPAEGEAGSMRGPAIRHGFAGRIAGLLTLGLAAISCGACSGPILSFKTEEAPAAPEPLVTGSIPKRPVSFGRDLDGEDWRRAHAALSVALDPQGNGRPVKWENPETAMRGAINPTGLPYVAGDEICRDFLATVVGSANNRFVRGTGCKPSGGEWELKRLRTSSNARS
ncbi:RT0821/Lpp0805 family surface protein [Methylobacterium sp. R2-1]|uniref:RT0821/Lpp0805 family surface protein n=1 Tax=Methylobacterium sp. R2-1 TaxID=2587064 RepID=UPI00161EF198|nr:RT0821/Lpp0805 family surface protein [Methylobacterium sp. R2-1]